MIENYKNSDDIKSTHGNKDAQRYEAKDLNLLKRGKLDTNFGLESNDILEFHVYDLDGNWLTGNHALAKWKMENAGANPNRVLTDVHENLRDLGFNRGEYKIVYNFLRNWVGHFKKPSIFISEITPSRTELILELVNPTVPETHRTLRSSTGELQGTPHLDHPHSKQLSIFKTLQNTRDKQYFPTYALNFGFNNILKVVNVAFIDNNRIAIKLYEPLPDQYEEKQTCWLIDEVRVPYTDNVKLIPKLPSKQGNKIAGPNFNVDLNYGFSTATDFKTWNELLDTEAQTSQQLIDNYFSGSLTGMDLNIDYSGFTNFIHFSSATERIKNFKFKLELIEGYDSRLKTLNVVTGSASANVESVASKKRKVISGFDNFEKWLYYETGSRGPVQKFTHVSESFYPWPKRTQSGETSPQKPYAVYSVSSSQADTYYDGLLQSASLFDRNNLDALEKTIPVHVRLDASNDQFLLFVNMIAQHFDIMWAYINNLSDVASREEHPFEGMSKNLIYEAARSMGWNLSHGNQTADLWEYALGTDQSGSVNYTASTGSLYAKTKDDVTKEIWRRLINNLPYILKTKGTKRSVKALMTCYGVPSTVLRIKEFGGPAVNNTTPQLITERFYYTLTTNNSRYFQTKWAAIPTGSAGNDSTETVFPDTIEFRFKPLDDEVFNHVAYTPQTLMQAGTVQPNFYLELEKEGAQSNQKGNLIFYLSGSGGYLTASIRDDYMLDGNFHSVMLRRSEHDDSNTINQTFDLFLKKHNWGDLTLERSASLVISGSVSSSYLDSWTTVTDLYFGTASNPTSTNGFTGSYQEVRLWTAPLSESAFNNHVTSFTSYNGNDATASFFDLKFRLPLINQVNHAVSTSVSSSHPNQELTEFSQSYALSASFTGFGSTMSDYYDGIEETEYMDGISVGGNNLYSDKIRIENNTLSSPLSFKARGERSANDLAPIDSNKVQIAFSPQDAINDDIYRHIGFTELDDYIGDPSDVYEDDYQDLYYFGRDYFRKYQNKHDIAAYIRVFSAYDFSLFRQICQVLPARVNKTLGLLVEPHVLERSRVRMRRPDVAELHYTGSIEDPEPSASSCITPISGTIYDPVNVSGSMMRTPSGTLNMYDKVISGSARTPITASLMNLAFQITGSDLKDADLFNSTASFEGAVMTLSSNNVGNCTGSVRLDMSVEASVYNPPALVLSGSTFITASLPAWKISVEQPAITGSRHARRSYLGGHNRYFRTTMHSGSAATTLLETTVTTGSGLQWSDSTQLWIANPDLWAGTIIAAADNGENTFWTNTQNVTGSSTMYATCSMQNTASVSASSGLLISSNYQFSIPTLATITGIEVQVTRFASGAFNNAADAVRDEYIYVGKNVDGTLEGNNNARGDDDWSTSPETAVYGNHADLWGNTWTADELNSGSFCIQYSVSSSFDVATSPVEIHEAYIDSILVKCHYKVIQETKKANSPDSLPLGIENHRFRGCKITSADWNVDSKDTVDGGPVVEVVEVDSRKLIYQQLNEQGSFKLDKAKFARPVKINPRGLA